MVDHCDQFKPGQRVAVTQQIPKRNQVWTTRVEGTVQQYEQRQTGSWFAHTKLWLDRLTLQKDDGEIVVCILDNYSHVLPLPQKTPPQQPWVESPDASASKADEPSSLVEERKPQ